MTDPYLADHATGVELQIEELVHQRETARHDGWDDEADALETEIADLQLELAETAEQAADEHYQPASIHGVDTADHLSLARGIGPGLIPSPLCDDLAKP
jgi:hypothetical protein